MLRKFWTWLWRFLTTPSPSRRDQRWQMYDSYLRSPQWAAQRQRRLAIDGWRCQVCGSRDHLEVHHLYYNNLGREPMSALITLCHRDHERVTALSRSRVSSSQPQQDRVRVTVRPHRRRLSRRSSERLNLIDNIAPSNR